VTFQDAPYPEEEINQVKYLVFDSTGTLAASGAATPAGDGLYEITLTAEATAKLAEGSTRIEVVVVSNSVAVPSSAALEVAVAK